MTTVYAVPGGVGHTWKEAEDNAQSSSPTITFENCFATNASGNYTITASPGEYVTIPYQPTAASDPMLYWQPHTINYDGYVETFILKGRVDWSAANEVVFKNVDIVYTSTETLFQCRQDYEISVNGKRIETEEQMKKIFGEISKLSAARKTHLPDELFEVD